MAYRHFCVTSSSLSFSLAFLLQFSRTIYSNTEDMFQDEPHQFMLNQFSTSSGSRVDLPCDLTIPSAEDSITLILWYKNDRKSPPIYSVDARNSPVEKASHFTSDEFKNRAKFNLSVRPGLLSIDPVKQDDTGLYLCRVDFKWARTINTLNNLTIIEPAPILDSCSISNQTTQSFQIDCYFHRTTINSDKDYHFNNNNSNYSLSSSSSSGNSDESLPLTNDRSTQSSSSSSHNNKLNYHLEVYTPEKDKLIYNLTNQVSRFTVNGLEPGKSYLIYVYTANQFATSSPTIIRTRTLLIKKSDPVLPLESCEIVNVTLSSFNVTCSVKGEQELKDDSNSSSSSSSSFGDQHHFHDHNHELTVSDNQNLKSINSQHVPLVNRSTNRFHAEIFNDKTKRLTDNLTNSLPFFTVSGLQPGNSYTLYAYSSNLVSKSLPLVVKVDLPFNQTPTEPVLEPIIPLESCVISNQTVDSFLIECSVQQLTRLNMNVTSQSSGSNSPSLPGYPSSSSSSSPSSLLLLPSRSSPSTFNNNNNNTNSLLAFSNHTHHHLMIKMLNYHVQVYNSEKSELIHNLTNSRAKFFITNLKPATSYLVYAFTSYLHRKSDPIKLHVKTANNNAQQFESTIKNNNNDNPVNHRDNKQDVPSVPLQSCRITNQTWGSFIVECIPGSSSSSPSSYAGLQDNHYQNPNYHSQSDNNHYHLPSNQNHDPSARITVTNTWPNVSISSSPSPVKSGNLGSANDNHDNNNDSDKDNDDSFDNLSSSSENALSPDNVSYNYVKDIYHLEVINPERDKVLYNMTNSSPLFAVSGLEPSTSYTLYIYSSNKFGGRSSSLILKSGTLTMMNRKQDYTQGSVEIFDSRVLILVLGLSCLLLLIALMILIILKIRKRDSMISIRNKNRMEISSSSSTENQLNLHHHNNPKGSTISDGLTTLTPTSEYSYGQPGQHTLDFDRKPFGQPQQLPQSHPHHQQHQQPHQPKWILVNSNPTNPDVIPTKANLPQGNSGNCSNLSVNNRLLDGCPISPPLSGTLIRGVASIKVDPNVLNGAYNVPHVRLITNNNNNNNNNINSNNNINNNLNNVNNNLRSQSQMILSTSPITRSPELSIFSEETFDEPKIVSFSTAV
ncbi:GATA zinc finger domain-containing protein 14-like isoform X2 [Panonychus citri]|uniref:GATA zinc finger domain-containing protein 14-like isoform X2 n=1 Tax=Panonychus citri TaxID=50023 RepID=UPI002306F90B|nr:GATA zinc finger domain-containing protein 14-like isoform X2 [Panonychus citri]